MLEIVRRLAGLKAPGAKILSLYLDLDPSSFPNPHARRTELDSLLAEAERRYLKEGSDLSQDQKSALRQDLSRVKEFFEGENFTIARARGLALFCSNTNGIFEVVRLARQVESGVVVDDSPFVEPLHHAVSADGWCVFLVNRRNGRILVGSPERLEEVGGVSDLVHGWHDQGGWSQGRYQRGIEKEIRDHVKHACDALFDLYKSGPFDRLIVGTPKELWPEVEAKLHPYLRGQLAGRIEIDVEHATPEQIRREAQPVAEAYEKRRERAVLDRLREATATGNRAVAGLPAVLSALNERRVEVLIHEKGFRSPGLSCPTCGWLAVQVATCPIDDTELKERDDIVEEAVELALSQAAEILVIRHHHDLEEVGPVGALLRF